MARLNVLGVGVSAISMPQALDTIDEWITARSPNVTTHLRLLGDEVAA
jgi:hypothetical protein